MSYGQPSLKKAIGVLKDSTTVGLAKVNSDKKGIDVAIVKATNHENVLPKEKHVKTIFAALPSSRPRELVGYCIHGLAKRLAKTHTWTVAMKTLIVLHRATKEVDFSFCEELISYSRSKGLMQKISRFTDDSSENAWDCSAWVRTYALYIEERLECLRVLKCDIEAESLLWTLLAYVEAREYQTFDCYLDGPLTKAWFSNWSSVELGFLKAGFKSEQGYRKLEDHDIPDLLEQLPVLQQLLFRLLACQPEGAAKQNSLIKYALTTVAGESVRIHAVITDGVLAFPTKLPEMQPHDAVRALEIYRKAGSQAEGLSEFYEMCNNLGIEQDLDSIKIEPPPACFLSALEDHVKESQLPSVHPPDDA